MKKLFLSLLLLIGTSVIGTFAQSSLVATLNHNDSISVYYGIDALKDAYNASVSGDVITLSSGGFNAPTYIERNITLRGAGMEQDSVNKVAPTILLGDFTVETPKSGASSSNHLTIEGIWHDGWMFYSYYYSASGGDAAYYADLRYAEFIKCRFKNIQYSATGSNSDFSNHELTNVKFIQCKIQSISATGNATFLNCHVRGLSKPRISTTDDLMNYECINCVVHSSFLDVSVNHSTFVNCVLLGSNPLHKTNMAYNCVGVYTSASDTISNLFSDLPDHLSNVCYRNVGEVFDTKTYDGGSYSDSDTYQLLDSIRTKYLGTDGTEVGMYGGALPFNPQNSLPKIKKFNVASKSNADGKLSVEIEVSAAGE